MKETTMPTGKILRQPRTGARFAKHSRGLSIVELMIAMSIGLILMLAVGSLFIDVLKSNREQFKAAQQIENGRYAIDVVYNDLRHAGFYGEFGDVPSSITVANPPDPCTPPGAATITSTSSDAPLSFHVQGYSAATSTALPNISTTACGTWLNNTLRPGSDVLVIRRADTAILIDPTTTTPNPTAVAVGGQVYLQSTADRADLQIGTGATIDKTMDATSSPTTIFRKDFSLAPTGAPLARPAMAATLRRFRIHVYYVSKCSKGTGSNGQCATGDDSIPTLKRLELTASGGASTMEVVPIAEGIEFFKVSYGLDNESAYSGRLFDAIPEEPFVAAPATTAWPNVMAADIRILARNTDLTVGHSDIEKSYDLGAFVYKPADDVTTTTPTQFRRSRFQTRVYMANPAGRREF